MTPASRTTCPEGKHLLEAEKAAVDACAERGCETEELGRGQDAESFQRLVERFDAYLTAGGLKGDWPLVPEARCPRCATVAVTAHQGASEQTASPGQSVARGPRRKRKAPVAEIALGLGIVAVVGFYMAPLVLDAVDLGGRRGSARSDRGAAGTGFPKTPLATAPRRPATVADIAAAFNRQRAGQSREVEATDGMPAASAAPVEVGNGSEPPAVGLRRPVPDSSAPNGTAPAVSSQGASGRTGEVAARTSPSSTKPRQQRWRPAAQPAQRDLPREAVDSPPPLGFFFETAEANRKAEAADKAGTGAPGKLEVPVGTRLQARLDVGISSAHHGRVIARLTKPLKNRQGRVLAPTNAVLVGASSSDAKRVYVHIQELHVGRVRYRLKAQAIDHGLPGLRAKRQRASLEQRQGSEIGKGALELGKDVAIEMLGPAGNAARLLGEGAVDEAQQDREVDPSVVLVVMAGTPFDVVVTE